MGKKKMNLENVKKHIKLLIPFQYNNVTGEIINGKYIVKHYDQELAVININPRKVISVNEKKYSLTTTKYQNIVKRAIKGMERDEARVRELEDAKKVLAEPEEEEDDKSDMQKAIEKETGAEVTEERETAYKYGTEFELDNGESYMVFKDESDAESEAVERVAEDMDDQPELFTQDWLDNYRDEDEMKDSIAEMDESYARDIMSEDDSEYKNRLVAEMVETGLITDEEAREEDFDEEDKIDDFAEAMTEEKMRHESPAEYIRNNLGEESLKNFSLNINEASQDAVNEDGIAHFLSHYDGNEVELDDGMVAYRTN